MATHKKLMMLLSKASIDEETRHNMVYTFTKGRTKSTRDLTLAEIKALCSKMDTSVSFVRNIDANAEIEKRKKRSIVLKIATDVGIHDTNNWSSFNRFMKNSSVLKKQLNSYQLDELDALIRQFRAIKANFNRAAKKVGTKAHSTKYKLPQIVLN